MTERLGVRDAARSAGVSVRTLQYDDRIGLLTADRDAAERRVYRPAHLLRLQQIRFLVGSGMRPGRDRPRAGPAGDRTTGGDSRPAGPGVGGAADAAASHAINGEYPDQIAADVKRFRDQL